MLQELNIKNFALMDQVQVDFRPGLNVLTGETGAGKSILAGALGLILGGKNENGVVREGTEEAALTGVFQMDGADEERDTWLGNNSLSLDQGQLILRRIIRNGGRRGSCYIQGQGVTRPQLEELASFLVDLHGQHEHQSLFSPENHRKSLDRFLGLSPWLSEFYGEFLKLTQMKKDFDQLLSEESRRSEELNRLEILIKEIEEAKLQPGEEEELKAQKRRLDQHEKLYGALDTLHGYLLEGSRGAVGALRSAQGPAVQAAGVDPQLADLQKRLETASIEVEDIAQGYRSYQLHLEFSPEKLEEINQRLAVIYGLQKRVAPMVEGILEVLKKSQEKKVQLENWSTTRQTALQNLLAQEKVVMEQAQALSQKRQEGALRLEKEIKEALSELGMAKGDFKISFAKKLSESGKPLLGPSGLDVVEFLFSANLGESLKPLKDIASGGELSRVMLALKSILSDADNIPILVFDEIDTGIGGEMGLALGRFMRKIAQTKQVLCITHLASIASFGTHHLKIEKIQEGGRTRTQVSPVEGDARVKEIARMLSGDTVSDLSLGHARELLESHRGG